MSSTEQHPFERAAAVLRAIGEDMCKRVGVDLHDPANAKMPFLEVYTQFVNQISDLKEWQVNICNLLSKPLEAGDRVEPGDAYDVLSGLLERGLPHHNDPSKALLSLWMTAVPELQPGIEAAMKALGIDPYTTNPGHEE